MPKLTRLLFVLFLAFTPILTFTPTAQAEPLQGLGVDVYTFDPSALPDRQPYILCEGAWTSVSNIDVDWGGDVVADCQNDFVLIHYSGWLISPKSGDITFQSWADDGFFFSLDDMPVIDDWYPKGCSGNAGTIPMVANQPYKFDAWWYEYGGGACNHLYWDAEGEGMNVVSSNAFSSEPIVPVVIPTLSKPLGLNGVANGSSVDLVWASIVEDTPIERYAVSWTYGDNPGWGVATSSQAITIDNLPEDTDITFWIRSDNDSLGIYSEQSDPIVVHTGFDEVIVPVDPVDPPIDPVDPVDPPIDPVDPVDPPVIPNPPVVIPDIPIDIPVVTTPIIEKPVEKPVVEPISDPIPEPSITDIDLASIDPQSLSKGDLILLTEDALKTFETALEGSPEYNLALQQLMVVAQADDIVISEELANVPVLGATIVGLTNAFNALGNFGADMSPKVRAKAKQEVVAAVIVTQIATTAVGLTASAPSSTRRIK
jgi:hypothetical protein